MAQFKTLFGFKIGKKGEEKSIQPSFTPPALEDGSFTVTSAAQFGTTAIDLDGSAKNEVELITRYREISMQPELAAAIDDIVNEAIVHDDSGKSVEIVMDKLKQPDKIKRAIEEEFKNILRLLNFDNIGSDIFQRYYIDGRLFYNVIIDNDSPQEGIKELRYIDPRKIRKIREVKKQKDNLTSQEIITGVKEYYIYSDKVLAGPTQGPSAQGIQILPDAIINVNSGLVDAKRGMVLSYLHSSIKPLNQLRMIEDAVVIYRLARAAERRIFYIDTGNLPKLKAEQHVKDVMTKYRNRLVYNSCLSLDTLIPILDGRILSLQEIINEFNSGKSLWVYSCHPKSGEFAPGIVTEALITKRNTEVLKITLSNTKSITCTPDHKFPVWGKGFVEAQHLSLNDVIIPFHKKEENDIKIYQNDTKTWDFCYNIVAEWVNNKNFLESSITKNIIDDENPEDIFIIKIEKLEDKMDVGTIGVDSDEIFHDYHTFALDAGIYTKNSTGQVQSEYRHLSMIEDFWMPRRCITLDTKIKLINGTKTLKEIINDFNSGKQNYTYSISHDGKNIVPGLISWAGITKKNTTVLQINLSNDQSIKCTPDHKFILKNNTIIEAELLKPNDLLCSEEEIFIKSIEKLKKKMDTGTITVDENHTEHDFHNFLLDCNIFIKNSDGRGTEITTLPSGCLAMDTKVSLTDGRELNITEIENELKLGKKLWTYSCEPMTGKIVPGLISWAGVTQKSAKVMKITLDNKKEIICTLDHRFPVKTQKYKRADEFKINDSIISLHRKNNIHEMIYDVIDKKWKYQFSLFTKYNDVPLNTTKRYSIKDLINNIYYNTNDHKIINIEYLIDPIEVGTLTIDFLERYHDYHTFALSCGVMTFNSNLGQLEDVNYFERKLYKSLNVPVTRLDPSQATSVGRSTEITRDELKFSKFISKLRKRFTDLFDQALRIQLSLKGICTEEEWKIFKEDIYYDFLKDNNFVELKETELLQSRLSVLGIISQFCPTDKEFYSKKWISRHVLRLNDLEAEDIEEQIAEEKETAFQKQSDDQKRQIFLQKQAMDLQNELMPQQDQEEQDQDNPYLLNQK